MSSNYRLIVEPLSGVENYSTWAVQMEDILNDLGLDSHIQDKASPPSGTSEAATWKAADRKALTQIRLRVAPHLVIDITNSKTALEAWTALKTNYSGQGSIGTILALRKLFSTRATPGVNMEEHVRAMKRWAEDLRTSGYPLENKVVSLALLASVPDEWDTWASSLILDEELLKNPSKTTSAILMESRRRNFPTDIPESAEDPTTALATRGSFSRKPRSSAPQPSSPAPSAPSPSGSQWQNATCHRCGGKGHIARVCPSDAPTHAHFADINDEDISDANDEDFDFAF